MKSCTFSVESTTDLPVALLREREIPFLTYTCLNGEERIPDTIRDDPAALDRFYAALDAGATPTTTQLTPFDYKEFFEPLPDPVLHLCFGTGMTASYQNACAAAEELRAQGRDIHVVDSLCSAGGYGLLALEADDLLQKGATREEAEKFLLEARTHVHHSFYCTTLSFFRRSGRVKGSLAIIGTMLGICPLMHLNRAGQIVVTGKARGKVKARLATLSEMMEPAQDGAEYSGHCIIGHTHALAEAEQTRRDILAAFPKIASVDLVEIGPVIAAHCGPGTVAVFYMGDERAE